MSGTIANVRGSARRCSTGHWLLALAITACVANPVTAQSVTFSEHIAPIFLEHCASCHRAGGAAPFPLERYVDARPRASQIAIAVRRRLMPPWKPEPGYGDFVGSRRLSDEDVALIERWVEQGSREGRQSDLPAARRWPTEWDLGPPDVILQLPQSFVMPADGPDRMRNFVVPIPVSAKRYVRAWQFRTDSPQIVHHATMVIDPTAASRRLDEQDPAPGYEGLIPLSAQNPDGYFLGWTPGRGVSQHDPRMAWPVSPHSDLVMMLHLRPAGLSQPVNAAVGLYLTDTPPAITPVMVRLNRQDIDIPAGERRYAIADSYTLPVDVDVVGIQPHAHNLAREVRALATLPDGTTRPLLHIRDWDFHWQDAYQYASPVPLPAGSVLRMEFLYDNSTDNRANPYQPPRRTTYGQRTDNEMGDVWIQVVPRRPNDLPLLAAGLRQKLIPQNIAGYQMMLRTDPDNVSLHDDLALLYMSAGNLQGAAAEFRASLRLQPQLPAAHYNVGNVLLVAGRANDAEPYFRDALRLDPSYGLAHQGLALTLDATGRTDEGIGHLDQAARLMTSAEVRYNLGVLLQKQGRDSSAAAAYREALGLEPDRGDARLALAWLLATSPDAGLMNGSDALTLLDGAPVPAKAMRGRELDVRAAALARVGRFEEAVASARAALAAVPEGDPATRAALEQRLRLYERRQPYSNPPPGR